MILVSDKTLELSDITQIIRTHDRDRQRKLRLKAYYRGEHRILSKRGRINDAPNNKVVCNYCEYITNMSTGFFLGRPIAYSTTIENELRLKNLLNIFKYNDESAHNLNLAEEASITGEAYEVLYIDSDSMLRFRTLPSEEMILIVSSDLEENIKYAIRRYRLYNFDGITYSEFVDVYDDQSITSYSYNAGSLRYLDSVNHYFSDVPIVRYANNHEGRGDFESVISLVDAYNKAQSLTLDDIEDFTDAFLCLSGYNLDGETAKELRQSKIIQLDDGGSASWLIKNLNDTYIENIKTRLNIDIHKLSQVPDMSDDNFAGNSSGVSIKYKLLGLELIRARKEREFKKAIQRRIELIGNIERLKNRDFIDFRDVEIVFTPNIPADNNESANIVKNLTGLVSQKRLLSLLSFVDDPAAEMEEIRKESEERLND